LAQAQDRWERRSKAMSPAHESTPLPMDIEAKTSPFFCFFPL
jgi:hypothetical protein